ncbi:hypothetical protein BKN38_06395 [Helicobacter sp. CLO-3]|uniref:YbgC/FadM family acyl-CoA thioesterase n=1 Tax=unclassified Helicobacter TaxID=2593540 RepID=UPI000805F4CB|nr:MULTISPECIES: YbgC/FadM family acyl-CoA thioesterase [unclassified Helicobacter]OBV29717.1 hypothetical protein BA723_04270 [Helicobacter sp. CLO-3]OHU82831.1 hypothetical protein BKN38_06395 [Helicobacter sp. CLO-3]
MRVRIYYEDTDCGGIVYHTNYIKYCERARSELFFGKRMLPSLDTCGFVVSAMEAKFLGFAKLGDVLFVRTEAIKLGKVQLVLRQRIYRIQTLGDADSSGALDSSDTLDSSNIWDSSSAPKTQANPAPETQANHAQKDYIEENCIFDMVVRMGYVDVTNQKPAPIPAKFLEILQTIKAE